MKQKKLWTYDFTVITIGSVVSMMGATLSGFAISLLVLDYTGSTFLYMFFSVCCQLPMLVCPILAGPYLDRMSRKKVIYTLDFTSAGIYLLLFILLQNGWFSYPVLLGACLLIGAINGVYQVAYDSFYPNLITEGNFRKAYSISGLLYPLAAMATPVAAALYDWLGSAAPVFAVNSLCFFTAACFERTIRHQETHMASAPPAGSLNAVSCFRRDFQEGMGYMRSERGLLLIALYFMCSNICYADTLHLPFFLNNAHLFTAWPTTAATLYAIVSNFAVAGRLAGGLIQYKIRIPGEKKFSIALFVYISINLLAGTVLFLPVPLMAVSFLLQGILGVTSYTIRTAATQAYVPDSKRARFNGAFQMLNSLGSIVGFLLVGVLGEIFPERSILVGANMFAIAIAYLFIYRGREHVAKIYNREV